MDKFIVVSLALVLVIGQTSAQMGMMGMGADGFDVDPWMGGGLGAMGMGMGMPWGMGMMSPWNSMRGMGMFPMGMTGFTGMNMLGGGDGFGTDNMGFGRGDLLDNNNMMLGK